VGLCLNLRIIVEVKLLTQDDLIWPLGQQDSQPRYEIGCGTHPRSHKIDPYPCYTHDIELVKSLVNECVGAFPLTGTRTAYYVLSHEDIERVNGTTFCDSLYKGKAREAFCQCGCDRKVEFYPLATYVVLSGKRTPIHPAMTRYLVCHEYGHMVWNHVSRMLNYSESDESKLYDLYMRLRGVTDYVKRYTGSKWHRNPGEIVANDFRLIFTNQEREFWPHDIPHPEETPIVDWWREVHEHALQLTEEPVALAASV